MDLVELRLQKVRRLHAEYQAAMLEASQALELVKNAEACWHRASQKASSLQNDYNFALAEYQEALSKKHDEFT